MIFGNAERVARGLAPEAHRPRPGGIKLDATKLDELEQQTHRLATRTGDLFFLHRGCRYGVDFKFSEAPKVTKSMRIAIDDLHTLRGLALSNLAGVIVGRALYTGHMTVEEGLRALR